MESFCGVRYRCPLQLRPSTCVSTGRAHSEVPAHKVEGIGCTLNIPKAAKADQAFYALLALVNAIRVGKSREYKIAADDGIFACCNGVRATKEVRIESGSSSSLFYMSVTQMVVSAIAGEERAIWLSAS